MSEDLQAAVNAVLGARDVPYQEAMAETIQSIARDVAYIRRQMHIVQNAQYSDAAQRVLDALTRIEDHCRMQESEGDS